MPTLAAVTCHLAVTGADVSTAAFTAALAVQAKPNIPANIIIITYFCLPML